MAKVYIETSIISYLTARPTSNLIAAAWQKETMVWWETRKSRFSLCISEVVIEEAGRGDGTAAKRRLAELSGIEVLPLTDNVVGLSKALIQERGCRRNCRHFDNAEMKPKIRKICQEHRFRCPEIATPIELMGVNEND